MSSNDPPIHEDLFEIREQLESLTKRYVEKLVASKESAADHVKMLMTVLNSIGDGLVVVDKDEKIVLANKAALEMAHSNIQDLTRPELGEKFQMFKDDGKTPVPKDQEPYAIALREKKTAQIEAFLRGEDLGPDGLWIRSSASPVIDEDQNLLGVVTIVQDITERKRLQQQRDALSTLITHDLKNHLASESMFLGILAEDFADRLSAQDMALLNQIETTNQRYLEIANTLLELYRTNFYSTKAQRQSVYLPDVINSVLQLNQRLSEKHCVPLNFTVREDIPKSTLVLSAIHQVLHNLIQNAIHVSQPGKSVDVTIEAPDSLVAIHITDRGPGLSQDLVDAFTRAVPIAPRSLGSTGLGLFLCRMLVEANGGKISLITGTGHPTRFTIELPIEK